MTVWDANTASVILPEVISLTSMPQWLKQHQLLNKVVRRVDFSKVKSSDSSVLALLLYWQAQNESAPVLQVIGFPERLKPLLDLYDMHPWVHFADEAV